MERFLDVMAALVLIACALVCLGGLGYGVYALMTRPDMAMERGVVGIIAGLGGVAILVFWAAERAEWWF